MIKKVLCVDDDEVTLLILRTMINRASFAKEVITACNGQEALDILQSEKASEIDLVFLDLNMPVKNGWDVLDEITESRGIPNIRVFILTSSVTPEDAEKSARYALVEDYIYKPLTLDLLERLKSSENLKEWFC